MMYATQMENAWRSIPKPRPIVDPAWAAERRIEYLASEADRLGRVLTTARVDLVVAIFGGDKFTQACEKDRIADAERRLGKISATTRHLRVLTEL